MKIGIFTIQNSANYGASIQSFALWKYLDNQGYNVEVVNILRPEHEGFKSSFWHRPYPYPHESWKYKIKKLIWHFVPALEPKQKANPWSNPISKAKFDEFNSQIKTTKPYNVDDLYKNPPLYDLYITGSDQLWNPTQNFSIEPYFLNFVKGVRKISYAASIAVSSLTPSQKRDFKKWLSDYETITVRERAGKKLLESFVSKDIKQVADPTFLLDLEYWKSIAIEPKIKKPYILVFTLSYVPEAVEYALRLKKQSGLEVVVLDQILPEIDGDFIAERQAGPLEWLGYIKNAELVVTNSFHCTLFSIFLETKNFYTHLSSNISRKSRIEDLLKSFDLQSRMVLNFEKNWKDILCELPINREHVRAVVQKEKIQAEIILKDAIDK